MNRLGIQRHDGSLATLDVGQWTPLERVRGSVAFFRCFGCGGTFDIAADDVDLDGNVGDEFICQTPSCTFVSFLRFNDWGLPDFDTTDVNP